MVRLCVDSFFVAVCVDMPQWFYVYSDFFFPKVPYDAIFIVRSLRGTIIDCHLGYIYTWAGVRRVIRMLKNSLLTSGFGI